MNWNCSDIQNGKITITEYIDEIIENEIKKTNGLNSINNVAEISNKLLSELDNEAENGTERLSILVDEILKGEPMIDFETELLTSDINSFNNCVQNMQNKKDIKESTTSNDNQKPPSVRKIEELLLMRERLLQVINVFEKAQEWQVSQVNENVTNDYEKNLTLNVDNQEIQLESQFEVDINMQIKEKLKKNDIKGAINQINSLQELSNVWKDTCDYNNKLLFIKYLRQHIQAQELDNLNENYHINHQHDSYDSDIHGDVEIQNGQSQYASFSQSGLIQSLRKFY